MTQVMAFAAAAVVGGALLLMARGAVDAPATSDIAVIESYVRMATRGQLLVGAYSRYQWHHPGPLPFYLMAPLYSLGGARTAALHAGAAILSLASIAWVVAICWRRRPTLMLPVAAALALYAWRAGEAMASPWNPHLPVLPVAALVVTAADVVAGAAISLPMVALLASVAGQAHVALVPVSLVLGAVAVARAGVGAVRGEAASEWRRALTVTAVVLMVCWMVPVYEQLTASPLGNLSELRQFFMHSAATGQPLHVAVSVWSDMLLGLLRPDFYVAHGWPFVESPVLWAEWGSLLLLGALTSATVRAFLVRDRFQVALSSLTLLCAAVGLWSATRIGETIFDHDLFWLCGIGAVGLASVSEAILNAARVAVAGRLWTAARVGTLVAVGVAVASAAGQVQVAVAQSRAPSDEARQARGLADDLEQFLVSNHRQRPFVTIDQDSWGVVAGAILDLQKRGRLVSVEEDWVVMFTPLFRRNGAEDAIVHVAMPAEHARFAALGFPVVSSRGSITAHLEPISGR